MKQPIDTKRAERPWIIAHRGYRTKYPENTLVAFQAALNARATMVELDVTLSRDRKLVVIHDATLDRTTNGNGPVKAYNLEQLKRLDAGSWFHPKFAGERLPELNEVLELTDGRALINIEIKSHAYESHHPQDAVERQVVKLVNQRKAHHSILISSFDWNILKQLSCLEDVPALALISHHPAAIDTVKMCSRLNVFSWHPNHRILTSDQVKMMHAAGIRVFPFGADTPEQLDLMSGMNVDAVITSDPRLAVDWLRHKKAA